MVVIKSTTQYVAGKGTEEISDLALMQMMGRAGRPQFDDRGVAVIMTRYNRAEMRMLSALRIGCRREMVSEYQNMVTAKRNIESNLVQTVR